METLNLSIYKSLEIPIIEYSSVVEQELDDMRYCTSAAKFERDLQELLSNGYKAISLGKFNAVRHGESLFPDKAFVVVFVGGYLDNYSVAFPILKRLQVQASIFVSTELIGATSHPRVKKLTPHFGWEEAQEMVNSGLINIYPMWHPFDNGKDFTTEVKDKISLLECRLRNNGRISAFAQRECSVDSLSCLQSVGIDINLTSFLYAKPALLERGAYPTVEALYAISAMDMVDRYLATAENTIKKNETALQIQDCCSVPEEIDLIESVLLPIEPNPRVRNYLRHAFAFSVLETSRKDKVDAILLREYIDLIYQPDRDWLDYHNHSYESWECFACRRMSRDLLVANGINIILYLIKGLQVGYYADIWLDTYYIPGKTYYKSQHSTHGLLLYGYDADKRIFHAISYNKREQYAQIDVTVENIAQACSTDYFAYVTLFRIQPGETIEFDFSDVCDRLRDYLQSKPHDDYHCFTKRVEGQSVQYEACLRFAEKIAQKTQEIGAIPQVAMYSYGEHKRLMMWRLRVLAEQNGIVLPELAAAEAHTVKDTKRLALASVKYNMTHEDALLSSIVETMNQVNVREKKMLEHFLELVENGKCRDSL